MNTEEIVRRQIDDVRQNRLTDLFLSHCDLVQVPEEVFELDHLHHLDLRHNRLRFLTKDIARLKELKGLYLQNNRLKELHPEIGELENLQVLKIEGNRLKRLPEEISQLKNLKYLYIGNNQLRTLPSELFRLQDLKVLNLSNNRLETLPEDISRLNRLEVLDLTDNHVHRIPGEISRLTSLQLLFLNRNQLAELPLELFQLTHLIRLDLNFNKLKEIPEDLSLLVSLRVLNLEGNSLNRLTGEICHLENLNLLNLDNNDLTELPVEIFQLKKLEYLSLSSNRIKQLPPEISQLKNLVYSGINKNPLEIPPVEIAARGIDSIRFYFNQLEEQGEDCLYESDLLLVGEPGVGKTTLVQKLIDSTTNLNPQEPPTCGVQLTPWYFPYSNEIVFRTNIRDFGGLDKIRVLLSHFVTKRSLTVVVLDNREEEKDFFVWFQLVEWLTARQLPVILVVNRKYDRCRELSPALLEGFATKPELFMVDLADNTGLEDLTTALRQRLKTLPHIGKEPLPKKWVAVRQALTDESSRILKLSRYVDICLEQGLSTKQDALQVSQWLHDMGYISHFQKDKVLHKLVFLNPAWVSEAFYKVLVDEKLQQKGGRFAIEQLKRIWDTPGLKEMCNQLLRLMIEMELVYLDEISGEYIIPVLLPASVPGYSQIQNTPDSQLLHFRYRYLYMPENILARFMVHMHPYICGKMQWRYGMLLQIGNAVAEILENRFKREIRIRIAGDGRNEALATLREEFKKLHESFHQLEPEELIPCRCLRCANDRNPHFFSYGLLKKFRSRGRAKVICEESLQDVVILNLIEPLTPSPLQQQFFDRIVREDHTTTETARKRNKIMLAYSHADSPWLERVRTYLKEFEDEGFEIDVWDDLQLAAGKKWEKELAAALNEIKIAVLLISTDFLNYDAIAKNEFPPLLEESDQDGAVIFPLILKPSRFNKNPYLSQFPPVNPTEKPLLTLSEAHQEEVLIRLTESIDENIRDINPTLTRQ